MSERKVVILTGASGGLGEAIALQLAELEANLVLTGRSEDRLNSVADKVRAVGADVHAVAGEIEDPATSRQIVNEAMKAFGRIDSVVNNAGILEPIQSIRDGDPNEWLNTLQVNLIGPLMLVQASLLQLSENHGTVINISSGASVHPYPTWGAYSVSKAALNHFTTVLSAEERQVTSIALRPGAVDTDMQARLREMGEGVMSPPVYEKFMDLYKFDQLLDPRLPAQSIAVLSLHAPLDWSGQYMSWDDERIRRLKERLGIHHEQGEQP